MTETAQDLLRKALTLNTEDRASLAGALIESLDDHVDADVTGAWDEEIERRVAQLESQAVGTVPWSAVRERLFHGFD